jgi:hypothetical protein
VRQAINERVKEPVNGSFFSVNGKVYLKFAIFPSFYFLEIKKRENDRKNYLIIKNFVKVEASPPLVYML